MKLWPRRLRDLTRIGAVPQDGPELALQKEVLVLAAVVITSLALIWVISYGLLGLYVSAAIPLTYQLVSVVNLTVFAKTKRYRLFRASELWLSLDPPIRHCGWCFPDAAGARRAALALSAGEAAEGGG